MIREIKSILSKLKIVIAFLFLILAASCGPVDPATQIPQTEDAYPAPVTAETSSESAYPSSPTATPTGVLLAIDKPVLEGDTIITGVGPEGLPIQLVNITYFGEELGSTTINADGTFQVEVAPIAAGIRIGLSANAGALGLENGDIRPGDGAINVPQVGYFYDSVVIR